MAKRTFHIVDHIRDMRPEDRERINEWFMARVRELMAMDYYPEIRPIVDQLEAYAAELAGGEIEGEKVRG